MKHVLTFSFLVLMFALASCEKVVCDDILIAHRITIVDQNGNPLSGIDLTIINTRTDKPLCSEISDENRRKSCEDELGESPPDSGKYSIISTSNVSGYVREGDIKNDDIIEVSGSVEGTEFSEQYTVYTNQCNFEEVIGPEVIEVEL